MDRGRRRGRGGSQQPRKSGDGGGGGGGNKHPPRPGDWTCPKCKANNFVSRTTCYRCDPNSDSSSRRSSLSSQSGNPGDWRCTTCGESNFARRSECHKCKSPKNSGGNSSWRDNSGRDNNGRSNNQRNGGTDWICQKCQASNRPSNRDCYKCSRNKSRDGTRGGGSNRSGGGAGSSHGGANYHDRESTGDIERLISILGRSNQNPEQAIRLITSSRHTWLSAWESSGNLSDNHVLTLIVSLAKLPSSFEVQPPPMIHLQATVSKFLNHLHSLAGHPEIANFKLKRIDTIICLVERLEQVHWDVDQRDEVKTGIIAMLSAANSQIELQFQAHIRASVKILEMIEELNKPWTLKVKATTKSIKTSQTVSEAASEISSWQNVNIGWLANPKTFQPGSLPKMKVPDSESGGVYNSPDEYFFTMQSLWNAMTFGDGNAALSPKCRWKLADKECGQVLWPINEKSSFTERVRCRTMFAGGDKCRNPVVWVCQNRNHNDGLCGKCFNRAQADMMGPPGPRASTHIYDGRVVKVDFEGKVFIQRVLSRRPPQQEVHWRTTVRLSCPNLVGLVKVSSNGAALRADDKISWAEIVFHGEPREESNRRQEGKLAVSLASISGVNAHDLLHNGDTVAIIDCQTFVPEFIPVLKALDIQKLSPLPFEQGALLNLSRRTSQALNGQIDDHLQDYRNGDDFDVRYGRDEEEGYDSDSSNASSLDHSKIHDLIEMMIDKSQLDPIVKIRMDDSSKSILQSKLTAMVQNATLDAEQLKSFLQSLTLPVHLTQGPPGTGKSYLGVVIVRALLLIRNLWMSLCPEVGRPPILVLSYKNHAIDEFLRDLINAERNVSLIRIGGSCKDQALMQYAEQNQPSYRQDTDRTRQKLRSLYGHRVDYQNMRKNFSPLINFKAVLAETVPPQDEAERKSREKAEIDAVVYVNNLIIRVREIEAILDDEEPQGHLDENWKYLFPENEETLLDLDEKSILNLLDGVKHYNVNIPVAEVLNRWMKGVRPLPKCCYSHACTGIASSHSPGLCREHQCYAAFGPGQQCPNKILEGEIYCQIHNCSAPDCQMVKELGPDQKYCLSHACFICLEQNMICELATDDPPRNACKKHPLCCAMMQSEMCGDLALPGESYCQEHKASICAATTDAGLPCKNFVKSRDNKFCVNHQPVVTKPAPIKMVEKNPNHGPGRCQALTSKKKPCKGKPMTGFQYCPDHANKANLNQAPATQDDNLWTEVKVSRQIKNQENPKTPEPFEFVEKPKEDLVAEASKNDSTENGDKVDGGDNDDNDYEIIEEDLPDEICDKIVQDNPDEVEESENVQHLREVHTVDERDEDFLDCMDDPKSEEESDQDKSDPTETGEESEIPEVQMIPSSEWSWEMSHEERLTQCQLLEDKFWNLMSQVDEVLKKGLEVARREHHDAKVRANTKVYENKAVIGGTIVGCITRLEAIRATQPFAILVEEASEVLEPLLFACLGSSTCKLELIGDHLQLKPSIMSKFQFEIINKVNISMFERLIRAPDTQRVPSTALSTQRRMRKNICDLTRDFYKDIVSIADHNICSERKIADWINTRGRNASINPLDHCLGQGREVPGILPHVFFWTHKGIQSKASVGLSRVNRTECEMACNLAKFLVDCGVPKPSIAILTPYKGQLMLMRGELIKMGLVPKFPAWDSCTLSTVDRFQGDEADIVIISLVIDAKSQTPFVKQVNRMIVLLSRARLGMFILANVGYFEEKPDASISHWQDTLARLRQPADQDTSPDAVRDDLELLEYAGPRLGPELPICCPLHRENQLMAGDASKLHLGFCDIACTYLLDCSHPCGLPCHFIKKDLHNSICVVKIDSPCSQHTSQLTCDEIFKNVGNRVSSTLTLSRLRGGFGGLSALNGTRTINDVLPLYRCDIKVDLQLPCTHVVKMTCAEENEIASGEKSYPRCDKPAHSPYIYPDCHHELKCLCHQLQEFKAHPAKVKPCKEKVDFTPSCTHGLSVDCFLKQKYEKKEQVFVCPKILEVKLPRCGHLTKVPCETSQNLLLWSGNSATAPDFSSKVIVRQGQVYGPKDYICKKEVIFERTCGHQEKMTCEKAFELAPQSIACSVQVTIVNPECGHPAEVPCHRKQVLDKDPRMNRSKPPVETVVEGKSKHLFLPSLLNTNCTEMVTLVRRCGHIEKVRCSDSRDGTIQECQSSVVVPNPICGHDIQILCHQVQDVRDFEPWPFGADYTDYIVKGVLRDDCPAPDVVPANLRKILTDCTSPLTVERNSSCGHAYNVKCYLAFKTLASNAATPNCMVEIVDAPLECDHSKTMKCWEYQAYEANPRKYKCEEEIQKACWNFMACGKLLKTVCFKQAENVSCKQLTTWTCPNDHSFDSIPQCEQGIPQECPECCLDKVREYSDDVTKDVKILAKYPLPQELQGFNSKILPFGQHSKRFVQCQSLVLHNFDQWSRQQDPMRRPLFRPRMIPCFIPLKEDQFDEDAFHPKAFVKVAALNGIEVFEWTSHNIQKLLQDSEKNGNRPVVLLFGIAFCCNVLVNPQDIPSRNQIQKKKWLLASWITEKTTGFGFDAVQHNRSGYDATVVWDPFPMIATHKIFLDVAALRILAGNVNRPRTLCNQEFVQCKLPDGKSSTVQIDARVKEKELKIDGSRLQFPWDSISLGRPTSLKPEIQKELRSKLSFCSGVAEKSSKGSNGNPFAGLSMIDKLLKAIGLTCPELNLLHALELQHHEDQEPAVIALDLYKKSAAQTSTMMHPLYLVACARLSDKTKPEVERNFIKKFAELYPDAVDKWLTNREKAIVNGTSSSDRTSKNKPDPNDPVARWESVKKEEGINSEAMDKLLKLTGLKKVKNATIDLFKSAIAFNKLTPEARQANPMSFNYCFLGNAGTGKTTVARLIAEILKDSGVRPKGTFVESSAQKLKDMGPEKFRELVGTAMDGVLFIDEAYDLDPSGDFKGKPIVSELLVVSENNRDQLSIILAGYEDDMNNKLFSYNEGLKSRFELINFDDFDEEELKTIWNEEIKKRHFECDECVTSVVASRLVKSAGRKGFGNARAVRKEAEKCIRTAMSRKDFDKDNMTLIIEDVMGETPLDNPKLKKIVEEINSMIGWGAIKKSVKELLTLCETNYKRELSGLPPLEVLLNRLFLGNPGTGKTTCAKLYGKLLKQLNFLSIGDVVISTASDFVGSVVGESQKKTNAMLEKARGKVLVIDEAYNLDDSLYGKQVLDVLVEKIQNSTTDDIAVLLLGYEAPMRKMLRDQNPGLARRFPVEYAFVFEDYDDNELLAIFKETCKRKQYNLSSYKVGEKALKILNKQRLQPNFGNAGSVNTLITSALAKAANRPPMADGSIEIRPEDIEDGGDVKADQREESADPMAPLDKLYRMEGIKRKLTELSNAFKVAEAEGSPRPDLGHFVFRGAPGTGKTTVARVMASILFKLGILARDHVEETSGLNLTGEYVGQTKTKVEEKLNCARGGVLFIDEAYELGKGHFGVEAMTSLVAAMTDPQYAGMAIIIAGYPQDMELMLSKNVGLKSRFQRFFDFPDWSGNDCTTFMENLAKKENYELRPEVRDLFPARFDELVRYPGWGNARDAIALWKSVLGHRANRVVDNLESVKTIDESDVRQAFDEMVDARKPKMTEQERMQKMVMEAALALNEPEPRMATDEWQTMAPKYEEATIEEIFDEPDPDQNGSGDGSSSSIRDPGVSEEVWQELELAKMVEAMEAERLRVEQEEARKLEEKKRLELIALQEAMEREKEEARKRELQRQLEEARERERQRLEDERRKREREEEERRKALAIQKKLQQLSPCPAGFSWHQVGGGWRCSAGGHFVSDEQLRSQFMFDV